MDAPACSESLQGCADGDFIAEGQLHGLGTTTALAHGADHELRPFRIAVEAEHDIATGLGQALANRLTHAAAAADHQGDAFRKILSFRGHCCSFFYGMSPVMASSQLWGRIHSLSRPQVCPVGPRGLLRSP
ncbi:hypothetical protein D9M69_562170 [compost metagenome]